MRGATRWAIAAAVATIWTAAPAHAGEMTFEGCNANAAPGFAFMQVNDTASGEIEHGELCGDAGGLRLTATGTSLAENQNGMWRFTAPADTRVGHVFDYERELSNFGTSGDTFAHQLIWYDLQLPQSGVVLEHCGDDGCAAPQRQTVDTSGTPIPGGTTQVDMQIHCVSEGVSDHCDIGGVSPQAIMYRLHLGLVDDFAPVVSNVTGTLASGSALRGTATLSAGITDRGVGAYQIAYSVDGGAAHVTTIDANGGACAANAAGAFVYPQPCKLSVSATIALDTTKYANGTHSLLVVADDAAKNSTVVLNRNITIANTSAGGAPAGGTTTSTATTAPTPPPGAPSAIVGAGGMATGPLGTLKARWLRNHATALTVAYRAGATLSGTLVDPAGHPIASAPIAVSALPRGASAPVTATGTTGADGAFRIKVSGGTLPQKVVVSYTSGASSISVPLALSVRAKLRLAVSSHRVSRRSGVRFSGRLYGSKVGRRLVQLQVRTHGRWQAFDEVRTSSSGRFKARRTFRVAGTYRFRALVRGQEGLPYATGTSGSVRVRVS